MSDDPRRWRFMQRMSLAEQIQFLIGLWDDAILTAADSQRYAYELRQRLVRRALRYRKMAQQQPRCGTCRFFRPDGHGDAYCAIEAGLSDGTIDTDDYCSRWEAKGRNESKLKTK